MNVMRIRRKCSVRGCGNTDCFVISRSRELAGSVIICKDCIKEVLGAIEPPIIKKEAPTEEHSEETALLKCEKCGKAFKSEAGLKKHKCTGSDK